MIVRPASIFLFLLGAFAATADQGPAGLPPPPTINHLPDAPGKSGLFTGRGLHPAAGGTGFFVTADGKLLTNNHVIAGCTAFSVEATDGSETAATLIAADAAEDLALLQAPVPGAGPVTFRGKVAWNGGPIAIIGYPSFGLQRIKPLLAAGTLTGPASPDGHRFQFQADIRHGNSGGPIFDEQGLVVGIVFAKIDTADAFRVTGQLIKNVGFAISNNATTAFLEAHGVNAAMADDGPAQDDQSLFAGAQRSLLRIVCWK